MKMQKIMRRLYLIFLLLCFSTGAFTQGNSSYLGKPDGLIVRFTDDRLKAGIITHYDATTHIYEVVMSPGGAVYEINNSGRVTQVSGGVTSDHARIDTQLKNWYYFQFNPRVLRISRYTAVVLCINSADNPYFGLIESYNPNRGYRVNFYGSNRYFVEIAPDLHIRRTNISNLQGQTLYRINVMTQVGHDNTFPY